jgi:hypothetical protein
MFIYDLVSLWMLSLDLSMSMNVRLDVNAFMTDFYILMEMRLD